MEYLLFTIPIIMCIALTIATHKLKKEGKTVSSGDDAIISKGLPKDTESQAIEEPCFLEDEEGFLDLPTSINRGRDSSSKDS